MPADGARVALLVWYERGGEEEAAAFAGTLRVRSGGAVLDRGPNHPAVELPVEWLERLQCTGPETRRMLLDADFVIRLRMGDLPPDHEALGLWPTGLRWPDGA